MVRKGGGFGRGRGGMAGVGEDEGFLPELGKKMNAAASWSYRGVEGGDLSHLPGPSTVRTRVVLPHAVHLACGLPRAALQTADTWTPAVVHMIGMVN